MPDMFKMAFKKSLKNARHYCDAHYLTEKTKIYQKEDRMCFIDVLRKMGIVSLFS